jgi:CofD-related protein of GAK system
LVFFSGGSALTGLARILAESGLHAAHILSVFDNGGSAGRLREACGGIAIGDIRKRLIAIGDRSTAPSRRVIEVLEARLPAHGSALAARVMVEGLACGTSEMLRGVAPQTAAEISHALERLLATIPADFEWRDASIGNLILAGRYRQSGDWGSVLTWAHSAVSACGSVLPVSTESAHLGARLANGRGVRGQSALTDETTPIESPIDTLALYQTHQLSEVPASISAYDPTLRAIETGRAIVYSWGSFYTSIVCSLLVRGIVSALAANRAPKVLLLNPFIDAETAGKQPRAFVEELLRYGDGANGNQAGRLVTHVLALRVAGAPKRGLYDVHHRAQLESLGVQVVEAESRGIPRGPELLAVMDHLLALAGTERTETTCGAAGPE